MAYLDTAHHESVLARFVRWWQERAAQRRAMAELQSLGDVGLTELATDLGLSVGQLLSAVEHDQHAADELYRMMTELGLDAEEIERAQGMLFRDLQMTCAACEHKGACHYDLEHHTAQRHFTDYCPNAATLSELRAS
ncbi:DUF6455 family protein [Oryzibacter oryziterrae]|uniref:DUF6455 family protein n=1 Tax=Oryzibacter oryziterrae TaxID=2766474 RepID=UPI001F2C8056|nr:DUF6455 family protein [Oryzibacter oryziterrae]